MDTRLLNKYIAGDVLPEEKKEVIRWMRESEEHREQLIQLHRIYNATLWNGNVDGQNTKNTEKKKYYEVQIINNNQEIASCPCTGKFRQKKGIGHVMKVLQKYVRFNYIQGDEKNRIIIY